MIAFIVVVPISPAPFVSGSAAVSVVMSCLPHVGLWVYTVSL
jgi:hypothetical protein